MSLSHKTVDGLMFRWDSGTLSWVVWDGSLTTGAITIGVVNQGLTGASDWRIDERRGQTILFAAIDVAANGDNTIVAGVGGSKIRVLSYDLVVAGPVSVRWK